MPRLTRPDECLRRGWQREHELGVKPNRGGQLPNTPLTREMKSKSTTSRSMNGGEAHYTTCGLKLHDWKDTVSTDNLPGNNHVHKTNPNPVIAWLMYLMYTSTVLPTLSHSIT